MPSTYGGLANNTSETWFKDRGMLKNAFWLFICAMSSIYGGYDGSLLNGLQALPKFFGTFPEFRDASTLGLCGAAQFLPGLAAPFVVGEVADRYGRKICMIIASVGICVGAIVQATCHKYTVFIGSRVIIGIAGSFGGSIASTMLVELAHPRMRSVASALNWCCYYIGSIIASWTSFGTLHNYPTSNWSWRLPCLLQCLVPAILLIPTFFMPESPRYLIAKGKKEDAHRILANQHANGDYEDELVKFEMSEIERYLAEERAVTASGTAWLDFFKTKGNRHRLFCMIHVAVGAQWNGIGIVSYYLVPVLKSIGVTNATKQTLVIGGLAIANLVFAMVGALFVERLGRRMLFFISTGAMIVTLSIVTALSAEFLKSKSNTIGGATIAFLYLFYGAYDIAWTPLNIAYPVEILSYNLRAKGMCLWHFFGSVALCLNTWVNPIALKKIGYWYYIVYIGVLVYLFVIIYFFFPETRGHSLEEIAIVFDGELADVPPPVLTNAQTEYEEQKTEIEFKETV